MVDIWYARVSDEPELLVRIGSFETQLRDKTQQLIRFGILRLVFADFDSRRRLHFQAFLVKAEVEDQDLLGFLSFSAGSAAHLASS